MANYDESKHPRSAVGTWTNKHRDEPEQFDSPFAPAPRQTMTMDPPAPAPDDDAPLSPLVTDPLVEGRRRGEYSVSETTIIELPSDHPGITRRAIVFGGSPELRAYNTTAAELLREMNGGRDIDATLEDLADQSGKATLLVCTKAGDVEAREVTVRRAPNGSVAYLPKGSRTNGYLFDPKHVIGVSAGYGGQQALADSFRRVASEHVPAVEKTGLDQMERDLPVADPDREPPSAISAAYLIDGPDFDRTGSPRGCMFMATDIQPAEGPGDRAIVNGFFWADKSSGLYSEHGSMYADELARRGGKIKDYKPGSMSFSDCWKDMPGGRMEAFRRVLGRSYAKDE